MNDIVVFIDHEQGVKETLRQQGYQAHAVLTISEIVSSLYQAGRLNDEQLQAFELGSQKLVAQS